MSAPIEHYALIGDTHTGALVGRDGSIDWLCLPRFDSPACFAALLGTPDHGRWLMAPEGDVRRVERRYRDRTLVLETEMETDDGVVRLVDCMPHADHDPGEGHADVARVVEGVRGRVVMRMELVVRFDYGSVVPWVRRRDGGLHMVAGPEALFLKTPVETEGENLRTVARFEVGPGDRVPFTLTWHESHTPPPALCPADRLVDETTEWWQAWITQCAYEGPWKEAVDRSLVTLKGLTYEPTGGIVAAPTTSLPEELGGERNWDYRYCWLRDATFTLQALLGAGFRDEAAAWRDWLVRSVAGSAADLQIMYGPAGERRLAEWEVEWLPGYEGSRPVRVGNHAADQCQLDVYGEVMDAMFLARKAGMEPEEQAWEIQRELLTRIEEVWQAPDSGLWEVRGKPRHFTHSKVMAWVAVDRAVRAVEAQGLDGPANEWRGLPDAIHEEVCREGFDADRGAFTQAYDSAALDAALLMIPLVGFLPADDERVRGTVEAIEGELGDQGFVRRYLPDDDVEGVGGGEGTFLLCTLWLAQALAAMGRRAEAGRTLERVLAIRNDVGLLAEQYDPSAGRMLGNFPQAFSHVGVVNAAVALADGAAEGASDRRPGVDGDDH